MEEKIDTERQTTQNEVTLPADVEALRQRLSLNILRVLSVVGLMAMIAVTYDSILNDRMKGLPFYWISYGIVAFITVWHGATHRMRSWILIMLAYGVAIASFAEYGSTGNGRVLLTMMAFMGSLLLGRTAGWLTLGVGVITMGAFGGLFAVNIISPPGYAGDEVFSRWLVGAGVILAFGTLMIVALNYFVRQLDLSLSKSHKLSRDLDAQRAGLEQVVLERTTELAQRARYLEVISAISHHAASLLDDPDAMLVQVVELIRAQFNYYNISLFLVDDTGEWLEMRAASSVGGKRIMAQEYRLRVGVEGIVGYVAARGEPRIVQDVHTDAFYHSSADLPDTRSEMALPLRVRGVVIGVLDVQSTSPGTFTHEDSVVWQSLADEVAIAVGNARLFAQLQESIIAERRARGELTREAWGRQLRTLAEIGFVKEKGMMMPASHIWEPQMQQAVQTGHVVTPTDSVDTLALPIKAGEQVIAVLDAQLPAGADRWSPEQVALLEALSEQVGQALERARLYQEAQSRVQRERTVSAVTARMREPLELEDVLLTAAEQIRRALNLEEFVVHLATGDTLKAGYAATQAAVRDAPGESL